MGSRQAKLANCFLLVITVLFGTAACAAAPPLESTLIVMTPSPPPAPSPAPTATHTASPAPPSCRTGDLQEVLLDSASVPRFRIYLPPCYDEKAEQRLPVLYLFHGQGDTDEQWPRLGVKEMADRMIASGEAPSFLIVMPYDKASWRRPQDDLFDHAVLTDLIPYVDGHYSTLPEPAYRAVGGLSRGAGWALRLGLTRPDLFGIIGLHSPVVFYDDQFHLNDWLSNLSDESRPDVYMDIGRGDQERGQAEQLAGLFNEYRIPHTWLLRDGTHSEAYWQAHMEEYLRWYASHWVNRP